MIQNQITETKLQDAIFDWLSTVVSIWDGTGTRPAGKIQFVWHFQQEPRFSLPLIMGRVSGVDKIARDWFSQPVEEIISSVNMFNRQHSGTREFTLYLESFGEEAFAQLAAVQDACDDIQSLATLWEQGITIIEPSSIVDAHAFLGTMPEERATLEIRMRTSSESFRSSSIIEAVELHGIINNGWIDVDVPTITIDTITVI